MPVHHGPRQLATDCSVVVLSSCLPAGRAACRRRQHGAPVVKYRHDLHATTANRRSLELSRRWPAAAAEAGVKVRPGAGPARGLTGQRAAQQVSVLLSLAGADADGQFADQRPRDANCRFWPVADAKVAAGRPGASRRVRARARGDTR
ncbi:hypothetical protein BS78_02G349000 [Paspalum vaginatum]|nr:hypothetical protein BS78_02G349000 [Paspalum vaginatum]